MKNITKTLITFIIFAISFSSCKKYEEGPTVSLLPKKSRLVGIWKLKKLTFNDRNIVLTDIDRKNTLEFTKEGSMYESFFYNEQYYLKSARKFYYKVKLPFISGNALKNRFTVSTDTPAMLFYALDPT